MNSVLLMVLAAVIVLGPLIAIHEFGHYWVARRVGVKVLTFSIGFGPAFLKWKNRHGTQFQIAAIPLGGFVRMADEREGEVPPEDLPRAFNNQPVWARMAIVAAGPLINLLFAVFLYWVLFLMPAEVLKPVVGRVIPDSPAAMAGIERGDEIVAIDGQPVRDWEAINYALIARMGESGQLRVAIRKQGDTGAARELPLAFEQLLAGRNDGIAHGWVELLQLDVGPRGSGLGHQLMERAVAACLQRWPGLPLYLSAQAHLQGYYGRYGFVAVTAPYLEDDIPHVGMRRT